MSLFKVYSGTRDEFPDNYPCHPGYAYFFKDDGIFMIDVDDQTRVTVNAPNIVKAIDQKPTVYNSTDILTTEGGFLGKNSLIATTDNNCVYEIPLNNGSILTKNKMVNLLVLVVKVLYIVLLLKLLLLGPYLFLQVALALRLLWTHVPIQMYIARVRQMQRLLVVCLLVMLFQ